MRVLKTFLPVLLLLITALHCTKNKGTHSKPFSKGKWIDLSYDFSSQTPYWPNNKTGFQLDTQFNGMTKLGYYYSSNSFCAPEHGGTHLDAPVHFARQHWSVDKIPIIQLTGDGVVINLTNKINDQPDYQISVADIEAWEKENGQIPDSSILLFCTGWGRFYPNVQKYFGTAEKGDSALPKLHFPSIHPDLATWLVKNRKVKAVGIDTPSIDYGQSKDFKTHQILLGNNIPGLENLANLESLPALGSYVIALPMKIKDGSGAPLRIVAWIGSNQ